ncbi:MAG: DoxX family protein [Candidatus Levybacteria bacterium]|nr:DoxX family protein [Candidatus Levybacteria bacterium]
MNTYQKLSLLLLRLSLGWIFLYSGVSKILDLEWTATGYLKGAQTLTPLYNLFTRNMDAINFLNSWGQAAIGLALILGIMLRPAAIFGILMMILYYIPILNFPYVGKGTTSFLVDQHIIFILVFFLLFTSDAGKYYGLKTAVKKYLPKLIQKYV